MAVGLILLALLAPRPAVAHSRPLWSIIPGNCPPGDLLSRHARDCALVQVILAAISDVNVNLELTIPGEGNLEAERAKDPQLGSSGPIWHGTLVGKRSSAVTFSVVRNSVVGVIAFEGKMYRLRSSAGKHVLEQIDVQSLPPAGDPVPNSPPGPPLPPPPECNAGAEVDCPPALNVCQTDDPRRVDLLVVYNAAAMNAAGGPDDITAWINLQVFEANRSYAASLIPLMVQLLGPKEIAFTETSNSYVNLSALVAKGDGILDDAHAWRNQLGADAVMLINFVPGVGISGLARAMREYHVPDKVYVSFEPNAFALIDASEFLTAEFALAHELGHVMGAQHNLDASGGTITGAIPDSSFGEMDEEPAEGCKAWMTIMSVRESDEDADLSKCVACDRLAYWSNVDPLIKHCGKAVGSSTANNRDTLKLTAPVVSSFRCGSATPNNVWMKDTWEDTGAEPDANTATLDMWKTPYIWVRNEKDERPSYPGQHRHQNPVSGEVNYIYAKLHNGGDQTSGVLEFWEAGTSTGLSWPEFTKIGSVPVSDFARGDNRIIELPWTPTDNGPRSLVARWESPMSDPMTTPESANIEANARGNNNIVWRNLHVIGLGPGLDSVTTELYLTNADDEISSATIEIKPGDAHQDQSFLRFGEIALEPGGDLLTAWRHSDFRGTGIRPIDDHFVITNSSGATLEGILLKARKKYRMKLHFRRPRDQNIAGTFTIEIVHSQVQGDGIRRVGGVTYQVEVSN